MYDEHIRKWREILAFRDHMLKQWISLTAYNPPKTNRELVRWLQSTEHIIRTAGRTPGEISITEK